MFWLTGAKRTLSAHAYLAEQLHDEASTAGISIIIQTVHNLVVFSHQLLVFLVITAAKILVRYTELQVPQRSEGWFII